MHRSMVLVTLGASNGVVHCVALHGTALPHFHHLPLQQKLLPVLTEQQLLQRQQQQQEQQQQRGTEQQQQEGMGCLVSSSSADAAVSCTALHYRTSTISSSSSNVARVDGSSSSNKKERVSSSNKGEWGVWLTAAAPMLFTVGQCTRSLALHVQNVLQHLPPLRGMR